MLLPALAVVVLLVLAYRRSCGRQRPARAELAALGPRRAAGAAPATAGRRHLAPVLLLAALTLLLVSLARPQATVAEPRREGTVILAFDVSTQHGGQRPRAHPARRGQGGGPDASWRAAVDDPARGGGLRRQRP